MDWKNQLTKTPYLVLFIVLISVGVGTVSALATYTFTGNVIINDNLLVEGQADVTGGPIYSQRSDGGNTGNLVIERPGGPTADNTQFVFSQRSTDQDFWLYGFDGSTFKNFVGFNYPDHEITFPSWGDTLIIDVANDKVGIGAESPTSTLDVVGNVTITGDLIVNGSMNKPTIYTINSSFIVFSPGTFTATVLCDTGDLALSGGMWSNNTQGEIYLKSSAQDPDGDSDGRNWAIVAEKNEPDPVSFTFSANCLDYPPAHVP